MIDLLIVSVCVKPESKNSVDSFEMIMTRETTQMTLISNNCLETKSGFSEKKLQLKYKTLGKKKCHLFQDAQYNMHTFVP